MRLQTSLTFLSEILSHIRARMIVTCHTFAVFSPEPLSGSCSRNELFPMSPASDAPLRRAAHGPLSTHFHAYLPIGWPDQALAPWPLASWPPGRAQVHRDEVEAVQGSRTLPPPLTSAILGSFSWVWLRITYFLLHLVYFYYVKLPLPCPIFSNFVKTPESKRTRDGGLRLETAIFVDIAVGEFNC